MVNIARTIANKAVRSSFRLFEFVGYHVVAANYNSPVPHSSVWRDEIFESRSDCVGIDWNISTQEHYLTHVFQKYAGEVDFGENPWLSPIDATILHAMIRHHAPKKIVEVGSGYSTKIAAAASHKNGTGGADLGMVAIDPNPRTDLAAETPGLSKIIRKPVQEVDLEEIIDCDLLFLDSSHIVKIGGDANYEILEIVPRLKIGAIVHWHDILLPGEYSRRWVTRDHNFWTEQYLLLAFLQFNPNYEIIWASRFMSLNRADAIRSVFPNFDPDLDGISSFWVRRVK